MTSTVDKFCVISINYKKTALQIRNKFAFTNQQIIHLYTSPNLQKEKPFILLSTCNRTEIYTTEKNIQQAQKKLLEHAQLTQRDAHFYMLVKKDEDAIKHLFKVASGLDSQILGDYEIIGQLKNAFQLAKKYDKLSGLVEKIFNTALECSKDIKNKTKLSDGTTSVSFYAIQEIKKYIKNDYKKHHIVLLGLGKIGSNTLKNICDYLPEVRVTIINRNEEKAIEMHQKYGVEYAPINKQDEMLLNGTILIVATGASSPIIFKKNLLKTPIKYIFDLAVPSNVHEDVKEISDTKLVNVDELSNFVNQTMLNREKEVPKAEAIIQKHYFKLIEWQNRRQIYIQNKTSSIQ